MADTAETPLDLPVAPQTVQEYHERGWIHLTRDDFAAAEADFRQAVTRNNRYAEGYFGWGVALKRLNRYIEARDAFEKALSYLNLETKKEDQARLTMLRRLARDHLEILQRQS